MRSTQFGKVRLPNAQTVLAAAREEMLLDLAHGVAGQGVDDAQAARAFEGGQLAAAVALQLGFVDGAAADEIGHCHFAPDGVPLTDYSRLFDAGKVVSISSTSRG